MNKNFKKDATFLDWLQSARERLRDDPEGLAIVNGFLTNTGKDGVLLQTRHPLVPQVLILGVAEVKALIAEKLEDKRLASDEFLKVVVEDAWRINAQSDKESPYHVYISTNLLLYSARLSELLFGGLGISFGEGSRSHEPQYSTAELADRIRDVLEGFFKNRVIPASEFVLNEQYGVAAIMVQFALLMFIVCHEFGHVIIHENRNRGRDVPFEAFARARLDQAFVRIIEGQRHDPDNRFRLRGLPEDERQKIYEAWLEEINADMIAASLALECLDRQKVFEELPDRVGLGSMGIHLGMVTQLFFHVYRNFKDPAYPMISKTHPPSDFRMYCVQLWLYQDKFLEAVQPWTDYTSEILKAVLEKVE